MKRKDWKLVTFSVKDKENEAIFTIKISRLRHRLTQLITNRKQ